MYGCINILVQIDVLTRNLEVNKYYGYGLVVYTPSLHAM